MELGYYEGAANPVPGFTAMTGATRNSTWMFAGLRFQKNLTKIDRYERTIFPTAVSMATIPGLNERKDGRNCRKKIHVIIHE